jgi:hypothetical protein
MRIVFLGVIALLTVPAAAFDFQEHKYVSNLALRIVLNDPKWLKDTRPELAALRELAESKSAENDKSFGDLVGLADYVSDPNPFFTGTARQSGVIDWPHLKGLKGDLFRWAQAAHTNENHFQQLALIAHINNHQQAIDCFAGQATKKDGRLLQCILFEAYAIHFLEDFLSPGHVATGRSGLPDFVALGLHDRFGAHGLDFKVANDVHAELTALVDGLGGVDFTRKTRTRLELESKDFVALAELAELARPQKVLKLHGDSALFENKTQAALVTALAVCSIREMLSGGENSFRKYCWAFDEEPACGKIPHEEIPEGSVLRTASIVYGSYVQHVPLVSWFIPGEILILGHENAYVPGRKTEAPEGRWGLLAETLVLGVPPIQTSQPKNWIYRGVRSLTPSLLVGGSHTFGGQPSNAYYLRGVVTIPRTNVQLSAKAGARTYRLRSAERLTVSTLGIAVEGGYSFIFVRFGGEWERDEKRVIESRGRLYLSTGISGFVPTRALLQKLRRGRAPTRRAPSSP